MRLCIVNTDISITLVYSLFILHSADLEIPGPAEAVPYTPPSADDVAKAKQKKPRKPVPKATEANTARYVPKTMI
jgi:hypothetical protein